MPRNTQSALARTCGDTSVDAGRSAGQMGWYKLASGLVRNKTVLDVGCGTGKGLDLLSGTATNAIGQDIDPRLASHNVHIGPLSEIGDNEFDAVVSVDAVEHIEDDQAFVRDLCRLAREFVFLTTPLWSLKRKFWPFHVREYTFQEFHDLVFPCGNCIFFKGDSNGDEVFQVTNVDRFLILERMINNEITNLPARTIQKLCPRKYRFAAHQAALVHLSE